MLQEENASHVYAVDGTQTREDSASNTDEHLGHELVTTVSYKRPDQVLFLP